MKSCETGKNCPDNKQIEKLKEKVSELPSDEILHRYSEIIKAIADPTRLKILYLLNDDELCVCELISALDKPQPTVSHHLNILKNAKLVKWRKEGVWIHYKLSNPNMLDILKNLLENE